MDLIEPPAPPSGPKLIKACPHCGADSPADALFCESCGYDFTTGTAPEPYALATRPPAPPSRPEPTKKPDPEPEPQPAPTETPEPEPATDPESHLEPELEAEAAPEPEVEPEPVPEPEVEPEPATEPNFEPEPDPSPKTAQADAAPESQPEPPPESSLPKLEPPTPIDVRSEPARPTLESRIASTPPSAPKVVRRSNEKLDPAWGQWVVEVWVDPEWHAAQESAEPIPSPGPPRVIELQRKSTLIGRPSPQRDIYPEIDCDPDTGVSRQQAELLTDGIRWWVRDLDSSNGTYVGRVDSPLPAMPIKGRRELGPDDRVYVGTWTRIVVRPAISGELG